MVRTKLTARRWPKTSRVQNKDDVARTKDC